MKICIRCSYLKENNEFKNNICLDCIKGIRPKKANNTKLYYYIYCECGKSIFPTAYYGHLESTEHKLKVIKLNKFNSRLLQHI